MSVADEQQSRSAWSRVREPVAKTTTSTHGCAEHWDDVHRTRDPAAVSWFESTPAASLELLDALGVRSDEPVLDAGAGSSGLAAPLLDRGFRHVTAVDVSGAALRSARDRLGNRAGDVEWIVADLLHWSPPRRYRAWHDRAVFHFLTDEHRRERYRRLLRAALAPDAALVVATFAADGPRQCSGLPTCGYDPDDLAAALGSDYTLRVTRRVEHHTPTGAVQPFTYLGLRRS